MFDKLVDVLVSFVHLFRCFTVLHAYQRGVILRLGKLHREAGPGLHWLIPFRVDEVLACNVVLETINTQPQSLTTRDGVSIVISCVVTYTVADPVKYLLETNDAQNVVEDSTLGTVSRLVEDSDWDDIRADGWSDKLTITVRRRAKRWGVDVANVQPADLTKSRSLRLIQGQPNKGGAIAF